MIEAVTAQSERANTHTRTLRIKGMYNPRAMNDGGIRGWKEEKSKVLSSRERSRERSKDELYLVILAVI